MSEIFWIGFFELAPTIELGLHMFVTSRSVFAALLGTPGATTVLWEKNFVAGNLSDC